LRGTDFVVVIQTVPRLPSKIVEAAAEPVLRPPRVISYGAATGSGVEVLVGVGLVGALLFVVGAIALARLIRRAARPGVEVNFVGALVLVAFAVHGVFDSFLTFSTAMYLAAAAVALGLWESAQADRA